MYDRYFLHKPKSCFLFLNLLSEKFWVVFATEHKCQRTWLLKPLLSYPGLSYANKKLNFACKKNFFGKSLFACKIRFAVEKKKKKLWGNFQNYLKKNFCVAIKNASHTISIYGNCMESIFFKKIILNQFFLSSVCSTVLKKPQKWFNFFLLFFESVFLNTREEYRQRYLTVKL